MRSMSSLGAGRVTPAAVTPAAVTPAAVTAQDAPQSPVVPTATKGELELTTGQRSAVASGSAPARVPLSPATIGLLAVGALIVVGVAAFTLSGGARGYRDRQAKEEAEKAAAAESHAPASGPAAGPAVTPVPIVPDPVRAAEPSPAPRPEAAVPSASAGASPSASVRAKASPPPAKTPARSAASAVPARPTGKDPLPPKNWEF
jgi:hypothetical protein